MDALLGTAQELDEKPDRAERLDFVGDLGLHDPGPLGGQHVLLGLRLENPVAQRPAENADAPPDPRLRGVAAAQPGGNRRLGELRRALVAGDVRR